mmetsp:Transcript_8742/g.32307  ORF Transcript_8742/g.32307 Transcript_8742/m.32307 type:complete len:208 (+) Transcript_8742:1771-2394(+)
MSQMLVAFEKGSKRRTDLCWLVSSVVAISLHIQQKTHPVARIHRRTLCGDSGAWQVALGRANPTRFAQPGYGLLGVCAAVDDVGFAVGVGQLLEQWEKDSKLLLYFETPPGSRKYCLLRCRTSVMCDFRGNHRYLELMPEMQKTTGSAHSELESTFVVMLLCVIQQHGKFLALCSFVGFSVLATEPPIPLLCPLGMGAQSTDQRKCC